MNQRLDYIDIAKGGCILLVVIGHIIQYNFDGVAKESLFNFIYSFHMPVFMMLAGFVASLTVDKTLNEGFVTFVAKKFKALLVPFLFWGLIITPFLMGRVQIEEYIQYATRLFLHPDTGAWFIAVLFFIQIYFYITIKISSRTQKYLHNKLITDAIGTVVILILVVLLNIVLSRSGGGKMYASVTYYLSFMCGYFLQSYCKNVLFNKYTLFITLYLFLGCARFYVFNESPIWLILLIMLVASISILAISKMSSQLYDCSIVKRFGRNSLSIYLLHYMLVQVLTQDIYINIDVVSPYSMFFALIPVAMIVAYACTLIGELLSANMLLGMLTIGRFNKNIK